MHRQVFTITYEIIASLHYDVLYTLEVHWIETSDLHSKACLSIYTLEASSLELQHLFSPEALFIELQQLRIGLQYLD